MERTKLQDLETPDYPPSFLHHRLSRREFLFLSSLVALKVLARTSSESMNLGWLLDTLESKPTPDWVRNLPQYDIVLPKTVAPSQLYGLAANTPFLYRASLEDQHRIVDTFYKIDPSTGENKLWAKRARIFIDDSFQPGIEARDHSIFGYEDKVLEQVADFAHLLEDRGIGLEVDAFDFFSLGNSQYQESYVYCGSRASSIYNRTKDKIGYRNFFLERELQDRYTERLDYIFTSLIRTHRVTNIVVASPGNEPNPNYISSDLFEGKEILTRWHQKAIDVIHSVDPAIAVVASVVEPWNIDMGKLPTLASTSVHGHLANIKLQQLHQYRGNVFIQETGFPERIARCLSRGTVSIQIPHDIKDYLCRKYIESLVDALVDVSIGDGDNRPSITPYITGIAGWKADVYNDWYNFFPVAFPQTFSFLYYLDTWLFHRVQEKIR